MFIVSLEEDVYMYSHDRGRDRGRKDMRGGRRSWSYRVRIWLSVVIVLQHIVYPLKHSGG